MSRRQAILMTEDEQREFLLRGRTAILTSISRRGLPHPVAMWYVTIDGRTHFATYAKSQKVLNFRRNPAAAVLVEEGKEYQELRGLLIQGRAEVIDDPELVFTVQRGLFEKYTLGVEPYRGELAAEVEAMVRERAAKRSAVVVDAENVTSWDHRKLAGAY